MNSLTGREVWKVQEKRALSQGASFYQNKLFYTSEEGRLFARDFQTQKLLYAVDLGSASESRIQFYKNRMFIALRNHQILALDPSSGKLLWAYTPSLTSETSLQNSSMLNFHENLVVFGTAAGKLIALNIDDASVAYEVQITYAKERFNDLDHDITSHGSYWLLTSPSSPATLIHKSTGELQAKIDITTNAWPEIDQKNQNIWMCDSQSSELKVFNSSYKEIASFKGDYKDCSFINLWNDYIVITRFHAPVSFYKVSSTLDDLQEVWTFNLGHDYSSVFKRPAISSDSITMMSSRGRLYSFQQTFKNF